MTMTPEEREQNRIIAQILLKAGKAALADADSKNLTDGTSEFPCITCNSGTYRYHITSDGEKRNITASCTNKECVATLGFNRKTQELSE